MTEREQLLEGFRKKLWYANSLDAAMAVVTEAYDAGCAAQSQKAPQNQNEWEFGVARKIAEWFYGVGYEYMDNVVSQIAAILFQNRAFSPEPQAGKEPCEFCAEGDTPIGHLYHFTDDGRPNCKNCKCADCVAALPQVQEEK